MVVPDGFEHPLDYKKTRSGESQSTNESDSKSPIVDLSGIDIKQEIDKINICEDLQGFTECKIRLIMILIFTTNFSANLDHGALPASITAISEDLNIKMV